MKPKAPKKQTAKSAKPKTKRGWAGGRQKLMSAEQVSTAMQLRAAGVMYKVIAEQMGFGEECVRRSVNAAFEQAAKLELEGRARERVLMNLARIEHIIKSHWANAADPKSAMVLIAAVKQETELLSLVLHADKVMRPPLAEGETVIDQRPVINVYEASPPAHLALKEKAP